MNYADEHDMPFCDFCDKVAVNVVWILGLTTIHRSLQLDLCSWVDVV